MLKTNISKKIADKEASQPNRVTPNFKISEFSRTSGVDEDTLSQILKGNTKNPGIFTVRKIADALQCSIDELISDKGADRKTTLKAQLVRGCIITTVDLLRQKKQQVSLDEFLFILKEIYSHSLSKKAKDVDTKFAAQYVNDFLKSKNVKG